MGVKTTNYRPSLLTELYSVDLKLAGISTCKVVDELKPDQPYIGVYGVPSSLRAVSRFCSTSVPLTNSRLVPLTFSSLCPLYSKQRHQHIPATSKNSWEKKLGMPGIETGAAGWEARMRSLGGKVFMLEMFLSAAIGQRPSYLSCSSSCCSPFGSFPH